MNNKVSAKVSWISRAVIESPYCIGLCLSEDAYRRQLRRLKVKGWEVEDWIPCDSDACVQTLANQDSGEQCFIVCLDAKGHKRDEVIGLLVHEAVHVWQGIVEGIGEDHPSSEFEAYAIQRIALHLVGGYDMAKKGKDKKGMKPKKGCK